MITNWIKKYEDGRQEPASVSIDEIDTSKVKVSVVLEQIVRRFSSSSYDLAGLVAPDDMEFYRAIDAISWKETRTAASGTSFYNHDVVAVLHATRPSAKLGQAQTTDSNMRLYYSLYDLTAGGWAVDASAHVLRNISVSANEVSANDSVAINRVSDTGRLWVVYVAAGSSQSVYSTTSDNHGYSWSGSSLVMQNNQSITYYDNGSAVLKYESTAKNTWTTASSPNAAGGTTKRSNRKGNEVTFTVTGNKIYLSTYTSTARVTKPVKQYKYGTIAVYIDGKYHQTINCHAKNGGHQTKFRLDKKVISNGKHKVRLVHKTGKYVHIDQVIVHKIDNNTRVFLDAHVRQDSSHAGNSVILTEEERVISGKHYRRGYIKVDSSTNCGGWGTSSVESVLWMDQIEGKKVPMTQTYKGRFHEDSNGLWLLTELKSLNTGDLRILHYMHTGVSGVSSYDRESWNAVTSKKNPWMKKSDANSTVMYTAGTETDSQFSMTVHVMGKAKAGVFRKSWVSKTSDLRFSGYDFSLPKQAKEVYLAFNTPSGRHSVGLLCATELGQPFIIEVATSTRSAGIQDLSSLTTDWSVKHTADSNSSSFSMNLALPTHRGELSDGVAGFVDILPKSYKDKDARIIRVFAGFDQGSFSYQCPLFTGILGEVSKTSSTDSSVYSISSYDYTSWLQKFYPPYIEVLANDPPIWNESANDYYTSITTDGNQKKQRLRHKTKVVVRSDKDNKPLAYQPGGGGSYYVGWADSRSDDDYFHVDTERELITQTSAGLMTSITLGSYSTRFYTDFILSGLNDTSQGFLHFYFNVNDWDETATTGDLSGLPKNAGLVVLNIKDSIVSLYRRRENVLKLLDRSDWAASNGHFRLMVQSKNGKVKMRVQGITSNSYATQTSEVELKGDLYTASERSQAASKGRDWINKNVKVRDMRCLSIGYHSKVGDWRVFWDNAFMYKYSEGSKLVTDQYAAERAIGLAFQGIIPVKLQEQFSGDWFATWVIHPQRNIKDSLIQLAKQNSKRWYFDYDGTFKWVPQLADTRIVYALQEQNVNNLNMSVNPSEYVNWVEVVDDMRSPEVRESHGDAKSIMEHGIRFKQLEVSTLNAKTTYQAQTIARGEYYKQGENMESLSCSLSSPLINIQPGDILGLSVPTIDNADGSYSYSDEYWVQGVNLSSENSTIKVDLELTSRVKAMYSIAAERYGESEGVPEYE